MSQLCLRLGWNEGCRCVLRVLHTSAGLSEQRKVLLLVEVGVKEHISEHLSFEHDPEFLLGRCFLFAFFLLLFFYLFKVNLMHLTSQVH